MKALVIGASGLVGAHLMQSGQKRGWHMTGTFATHPEEQLIHLDMHDPAMVTKTLASERPDVVFLTAFNPHVDECELHPEETRRTNVKGNTNVITAATAAGIPLIYYSSDYVFDGLSGPYRETDTPHPLNEYGRQKLAVERLLTDKSPASIILRTTMVYGWEKQKKNFFCQVLRALEQGEDMAVPTDQISTPTYAPDLAEASLDLVERNVAGIFHIAGRECLSRFSFAEAIAEVFGLSKNYLKPTTTSSLQQPAKRPLKGGLLCEKAEGLLTSWKRWDTNEGLSYLQSNRPSTFPGQ